MLVTIQMGILMIALVVAELWRLDQDTRRERWERVQQCVKLGIPQ